MESVYPGIFRLQRSLGANGYVVESGRRVAVIDPGLPFSAERVIGELRDAGLLERVTDILVTHHDLDHVGAAPRLQAATGQGGQGAVVHLGAADAEVLAGRRRPGTPYRRLLGLVRAAPFPGPVSTIPADEPSQNAEASLGIEVFPGILAIATAGHTDGHVSFLAGEVLFAGDAFLATGRTGAVKFRQFPDFITNDRDAALRSELLLREVDARWLCPGHGSVRELR